MGATTTTTETESSVLQVECFAVRKSHMLEGPAIFLNAKDANMFENSSQSRTFQNIQDAMTYLLVSEEEDKNDSKLTVAERTTKVPPSTNDDEEKPPAKKARMDDSSSSILPKTATTPQQQQQQEPENDTSHASNNKLKPPTVPPSASRQTSTTANDSLATPETTRQEAATTATTAVTTENNMTKAALAQNFFHLEVTIPKEQGWKQLGVVIADPHAPGYFVNGVHPMSMLFGTLYKGDAIMQVNGKDVERLSFDEVCQEFLPSADRKRVLQIRRHVANGMAQQQRMCRPTFFPPAAMVNQLFPMSQQQLQHRHHHHQQQRLALQAPPPPPPTAASAAAAAAAAFAAATTTSRLPWPVQAQEPPVDAPLEDISPDFIPSTSWLIDRAAHLDFDARVPAPTKDDGKGGQSSTENNNNNEWRPPRHPQGKAIELVRSSVPDAKTRCTMMFLALKWGYDQFTAADKEKDSHTRSYANIKRQQAIRIAAIRTVAYDAGMKVCPKGRSRILDWFKQAEKCIAGIGEGVMDIGNHNKKGPNGQRHYQRWESQHPGYMLRVFHKASQLLCEKKATQNIKFDHPVRAVSDEMNRISALDEGEFKDFPPLDMTYAKVRLMLTETKEAMYVELNRRPGRERAKPLDPKRKCKIDGCYSQIKRFGLCQKHGGYCKRCKFNGCKKQAQWGNAGGYCKPHAVQVNYKKQPRRRQQEQQQQAGATTARTASVGRNEEGTPRAAAAEQRQDSARNQQQRQDDDLSSSDDDNDSDDDEEEEEANDRFWMYN